MTNPDRQIIGQGERITIKALHELFPDALIARQVPLVSLLSPELRKDIGERALKETIDIVITIDKIGVIAVRVQDDRHKTKHFSDVDNRQRRELESSHVRVMDIWKEDCPNVFKEKKLDRAVEEIRRVLWNTVLLG